MKLTLEIPDKHAPELLRLIASLMPAPVEANPDPAPDHPELPLGIDEDMADVQWGVVETEPEDPTLRDLPWGELPAPPPTPDGKVWVNRGTFDLMEEITALGRTVHFLSSTGWAETLSFSGPFPHIELIDAPL